MGNPLHAAGGGAKIPRGTPVTEEARRGPRPLRGSAIGQGRRRGVRFHELRERPKARRTERNSDRLRAPYTPQTHHEVRVWSRRPRVRVPSLTPRKSLQSGPSVEPQVAVAFAATEC